jgi:hypothetical protein
MSGILHNARTIRCPRLKSLMAEERQKGDGNLRYRRIMC